MRKTIISLVIWYGCKIRFHVQSVCNETPWSWRCSKIGNYFRRSVLFFQIKLGVMCHWYFPTIRPYLYSLLPENTRNSGRFIVDTLNILRERSLVVFKTRMLEKIFWCSKYLESENIFTPGALVIYTLHILLWRLSVKIRCLKLVACRDEQLIQRCDGISRIILIIK
jgi:hypothetical protein